MPPAAVATSGRRRGERFEDDVGEPVHVACLIAYGRDDGDIGGGERVGDAALCQHARQDDAIGDAEPRDAFAELAVEIAAAGEHQPKARPARGEDPDGVDEVLEPLLAHESPRGKRDLIVCLDVATPHAVSHESPGLDGTAANRRHKGW